MSERFSRSRATFAIATVVVVAGLTAAAQQPDRAAAVDEQIRRIFQTADYAVPSFGPARWLEGGAAYSTVEPSADRPGASDIVRYDAATGSRTILIGGSRLVPAGASGPLGIDDYAWSRDGQRLLVFTNSKRVWRDNTRGDYWVFDKTSGSLKQLGAGGPASSLMFAKFSPDGSRVAYVREHNVFVERLSDARVTPLTTDGSETTINGTTDWVYEEELGVRDGFQWSPDGTRIAFWQFDTTGVGTFSLVNDTDTLYPVITRIPYPKAGTPNSSVRIGVVNVETRDITWMKTPDDPRNSYLARLEWVDPRTVAIQQLNRLQNRNDFLLADAVTGDVRRVFRDESKTWVDVVEQVRWIDSGRAFLWMSERDGWRHIFRVPREGGDATLVTRFDADVIALAAVDDTRGWVYVVASPGNATQRYLYRSNLDGSGTPERVTPANAPGTHSYDVAPNGRFALHTFSRFDSPPVIDFIDLPDHRRLRALTDTGPLVATLAPVVTPPVEFFTIAIGAGVTLDGWMLKPSHFDATRRYPVIVYVYGEVFGQTVLDRWGGGRMLFHRALAEAGHVVVSMDNRGTSAPKGAAWRKAVYGTLGDLSSRDQNAAIRALADSRPYIDRDRVGIWGWSGGGSNTLNAMFRFPDTYRVGVAVAPMPDQTLYDTIYQERYMGLPAENAAGYRLGSPINFADGLRGKLLLIHGSGDDNVHLQGTERLVNRLVELGKPFDLMVYPNRTHNIAEGAGTTPHLYRLIARYFLDHLSPGPRP
jgi:dipeptidyl-peptidase 4